MAMLAMAMMEEEAVVGGAGYETQPQPTPQFKSNRCVLSRRYPGSNGQTGGDNRNKEIIGTDLMNLTTVGKGEREKKEDTLDSETRQTLDRRFQEKDEWAGQEIIIRECDFKGTGGTWSTVQSCTVAKYFSLLYLQ